LFDFQSAIPPTLPTRGTQSTRKTLVYFSLLQGVRFKYYQIAGGRHFRTAWRLLRSSRTSIVSSRSPHQRFSQTALTLLTVDVPTYGGEEDDEAQRIINEEYKTWKKNAPFLYDMILRYLATLFSLPPSQVRLLTSLSKHRTDLANPYRPMVS
jgi:hypothetical protein